MHWAPDLANGAGQQEGGQARVALAGFGPGAPEGVATGEK